MDWIHLGQDYVVVAGSFEYGNDPVGSIKSLLFISFPRTLFHVVRSF